MSNSTITFKLKVWAPLVYILFYFECNRWKYHHVYYSFLLYNMYICMRAGFSLRIPSQLVLSLSESLGFGFGLVWVVPTAAENQRPPDASIYRHHRQHTQDTGWAWSLVNQNTKSKSSQLDSAQHILHYQCQTRDSGDQWWCIKYCAK